ncbi:hypothetical protein [Leptospira santarosai]|uniref:hypothetical protein n=1 Tax=Leptospira santarosai TaxID=28183 RepID=UPI001E4C8C45|nr:hypothetical protein [Leptospira santarosai]
MFEPSRIIDILHLGILNSISKIGLNTQILSKKLKISLLLGASRSSFRGFETSPKVRKQDIRTPHSSTQERSSDFLKISL